MIKKGPSTHPIASSFELPVVVVVVVDVVDIVIVFVATQNKALPMAKNFYAAETKNKAVRRFGLFACRRNYVNVIYQ